MGIFLYSLLHNVESAGVDGGLKVINSQMEAVGDSFDQAMNGQEPIVKQDKINKAKAEAREGIKKTDSLNSNLTKYFFVGIFIIGVLIFIIYRFFKVNEHSKMF